MLIIAPKHNTPGKRDAQEFQRCAHKLAAEYSSQRLPPQVKLFDNTAPFAQRGREVLQYIHGGHGGLYFFCHGWRTGIQAGFRTANIPDLSAAIYPKYARIGLFACSCAKGPRNGEKSFAAKLRGETHRYVFAHATEGHTAWNPHLICYESVGNGGYYAVPMDSPKWPAWKAWLRDGGWVQLAQKEPWELAQHV